MKIITITNQKGGVAKTTTTAAIAYGLEKRGYDVLVVDMDPQANLTSYMLGSVPDGAKTIGSVLEGKCTAEDSVVAIKDKITILPSDIGLATIEQSLAAKIGKEYRLKESLSALKERYDYAIIDTPPSLSLLTLNALVASDYVLIPSTADSFSTVGAKQLAATIKEIKQYYNSSLVILGLALTVYEANTALAKQFKELLINLSEGEELGFPVLDKTVRKAVAVKEAVATNTSIYDYAKNAGVAEDYDALTEEIEKLTSSQFETK